MRLNEEQKATIRNTDNNKDFYRNNAGIDDFSKLHHKVSKKCLENLNLNYVYMLELLIKGNEGN